MSQIQVKGLSSHDTHNCSLRYEPNNQTAMGELEFIRAKRPGGLPDVQHLYAQAPELLGYAVSSHRFLRLTLVKIRQAQIPLAPDERWTKLALELGEKYMTASQPDWAKAAFNLTIAYELLKDENTLMKLNHCLEQLSQQGGALPALSSRHLSRVDYVK